MNVHAINQLRLWPLVVEVILDPVGHVVGDEAVLQIDVAGGSVHKDAVATIVRNVGPADGHDGAGHGDVDSCRDKNRMKKNMNI